MIAPITCRVCGLLTPLPLVDEIPDYWPVVADAPSCCAHCGVTFTDEQIGQAWRDYCNGDLGDALLAREIAEGRGR